MTMTPAATTRHRWKFALLGGFDQVRLETGEDLTHLDQLDLKLWAALACPARGIECDERTLKFLDLDGDGRIRAPEVIAAVRWMRDRMSNLAPLIEGKDAVALAHFHTGTPDGARLLASARRILASLGRPEATHLTLADVTDTATLFAQTRLNGDGVIPPEAADDDALRQVLADIIATTGGIDDRSGKPGVDGARVEAFFTGAAAFTAWAARESAEPALLPLGAGTAPAATALRAVRAKIDDWFARCRLAAFDVRAESALNRREEDFLTIAAADLSVSHAEVSGLPLARVEAGRPLPLIAGLNPAWAAAMEAFRTATVEPLLGAGKVDLSAAEWADIGVRLSAFEAWMDGKPATPVATLGVERLTAILGGGFRTRIDELLAADVALRPEFDAIEELERLVRFHRDLHSFLVNFVNFSDFYNRKHPAMFQAGTLFLDGRACELCIQVGDAGKHAALAGMAKAYLAYCDCTRDTGEKMTIVAAFTGGDSDFLMVGRNGVFYDRKGRDWDATITKVVENPISVRQAFWSPYKKLVRMIEEQAAKRAAAAEAESDQKIASTATDTVNVDKSKAPTQPKKIDVGTVAALGVAFGAIGTLLTTLGMYLAGLFALAFWKLCLAMAGLLLLISLPSMLIAWLKLRQRNLAPILDANGWAVNGRVKLNVRFGGTLTSVATLPVGSQESSGDPFAERRSPWPRILGVIVGLCFVWSWLDDHGWIHEWTKNQTWGPIGKNIDDPSHRQAPVHVPAEGTGATPPK